MKLLSKYNKIMSIFYHFVLWMGFVTNVFKSVYTQPSTHSDIGKSDQSDRRNDFGSFRRRADLQMETDVG